MKRGLILYAGCGGFRQGVRDFPGWEWTAVEIHPVIAQMYQDNFPNDTVIIGDAHEYLLKHAGEYDFIQSSPPCQTHSRLRYSLGACAKTDSVNRTEHVFCDAMLWQEVIFLATHPRLKPGAKWLIENVNPYYDWLVKFAPQYKVKIDRHFAWTNADLMFFEHKKDFGLTSFAQNSNQGRIRQMSLKNMEENGLWFDIRKYKMGDKRQVLRNMFEPELAEYVFGFIDKEIRAE